MLGRDSLGKIKEKADKYVIVADCYSLNADFMKKHSIKAYKIPRDWEKLPLAMQEEMHRLDPKAVEKIEHEQYRIVPSYVNDRLNFYDYGHYDEKKDFFPPIVAHADGDRNITWHDRKIPESVANEIMQTVENDWDMYVDESEARLEDMLAYAHAVNEADKIQPYSYNIGDTVFLEHGNPYEITDITDEHVEIADRSLYNLPPANEQ